MPDQRVAQARPPANIAPSNRTKIRSISHQSPFFAASDLRPNSSASQTLNERIKCQGSRLYITADDEAVRRLAPDRFPSRDRIASNIP